MKGLFGKVSKEESQFIRLAAARLVNIRTAPLLYQTHIRRQMILWHFLLFSFSFTDWRTHLGTARGARWDNLSTSTFLKMLPPHLCDTFSEFVRVCYLNISEVSDTLIYSYSTINYYFVWVVKRKKRLWCLWCCGPWTKILLSPKMLNQNNFLLQLIFFPPFLCLFRAVCTVFRTWLTEYPEDFKSLREPSRLLRLAPLLPQDSSSAADLCAQLLRIAEELSEKALLPDAHKGLYFKQHTCWASVEGGFV